MQPQEWNHGRLLEGAHPKFWFHRHASKASTFRPTSDGHAMFLFRAYIGLWLRDMTKILRNPQSKMAQGPVPHESECRAGADACLHRQSTEQLAGVLKKVNPKVTVFPGMQPTRSEVSRKSSSTVTTVSWFSHRTETSSSSLLMKLKLRHHTELLFSRSILDGRDTGDFRHGSLADILTSPRPVRFTLNDGSWGGTSKSAFGRRFMSTRPNPPCCALQAEN